MQLPRVKKDASIILTFGQAVQTLDLPYLEALVGQPQFWGIDLTGFKNLSGLPTHVCRTVDAGG
ncbi:MAG: hypothetical protein HYR94_26745 [Chloroflexi bacterium]|nr:hypothetical protein [Chloroflexota bacterium]